MGGRFDEHREAGEHQHGVVGLAMAVRWMRRISAGADRLDLLKEVLSEHRSVTIEAHRGETPPYELHAYVRDAADRPLFACVLAPPDAFTTPPEETDAFQTIDDMTNDSVTSGLERWMRRVWSDLEPPTIVLAHDPEDDPEDGP